MTTNANGEQQSHDGASGSGELGRMLREARVARGLELVDVAELTHVRQDYLRALEEARYDDLPEDVYARNFVRLYAQAVGIPNEDALAAYQSERQRAGGLSTLEMRLEQERRGEPPPAARRSRSDRGAARRSPIGPTLLTFLLVAALVGGAVWVYNGLLFRTDRRPAGNDTVTAAPLAPSSSDDGTSTQAQSGSAPASESAAAPSGLAGPSDSAGAPSEARTVVIDVISDPPGARVAIDGFMLPGLTPIHGAPVTARGSRLMRVTLEGHQDWEESVDLSENRALEITLATAGTDSPSSADTTPPVSAGEVAIAVRAISWLEVYRGSARNEGERLVYTNAQPGETYSFDLPVYVYTGNAAGVEVTVGDAAPVVLGSAGAIIGRAFTGQ